MKTPLDSLSKHTTIPTPLSLQPKVFGCTVFVHIPMSYRDKLDPCAEKCIFVGYGVNQKGYRCFNPKTKRLYTTMNCNFLETKYYYSSQHSGQGEEQSESLSWLSYNTSTREELTNTETPHLSATEDPVPELISEVSNTQPGNVEGNDTNNTVQNPIFESVQEHEETVPEEVAQTGPEEVAPEKYVLPARSSKIKQRSPSKAIFPRENHQGS